MQFYKIGLVLLASGISQIDAFGCSNCLGKNPDVVYGGCQYMMKKMFNPSTSEIRVGQQDCRQLVLDSKCCEGKCSADPKTCLKSNPLEATPLKYIRRDPALLDVRSLLTGEPPYDAIDSTEELQALHPRAFRTWHVEGSPSSSSSSVEERGLGEACCIAVRTVMATGFAQLAPYAATMEWSDTQTSAVILMVSAAASAAACQKVFGIKCTGYVRFPSRYDSEMDRGR